MNDDTFVGRLVPPPENAVIGIVVPVPEPWAQLLVDWRTKVGDPQALLVPPHVTLLPPTEIPAGDRAAVTDTGREIVADAENKPGVTNLLTIHSALSGRSIADLEEHFAGRGYGDLKKELAEVVTDALAPIQARTAELLADTAELDRVLAAGATRAREVAAPTLAAVYDRVGFLPPSGGRWS